MKAQKRNLGSKKEGDMPHVLHGRGHLNGFSWQIHLSASAVPLELTHCRSVRASIEPPMGWGINVGCAEIVSNKDMMSERSGGRDFFFEDFEVPLDVRDVPSGEPISLS